MWGAQTDNEDAPWPGFEPGFSRLQAQARAIRYPILRACTASPSNVKCCRCTARIKDNWGWEMSDISPGGLKI